MSIISRTLGKHFWKLSIYPAKPKPLLQCPTTLLGGDSNAPLLAVNLRLLYTRLPSANFLEQTNANDPCRAIYSRFYHDRLCRIWRAMSTLCVLVPKSMYCVVNCIVAVLQPLNPKRNNPVKYRHF